jgi:V/A-type H+-transporting ATPase subunit E
MSLDKIVEKIIEEAREKAASLKAEALREKEAIIREAEKEAGALKEKILKTAREKALKEEKCSLVNASLEARKEILSEKQSLITECFKKAGESLRSLSLHEYQDLIKAIISKVQEKDLKEIIFSKLDREKLNPEFLDSFPWPNSLADIPSGVSLKGERLCIDCTLERMMEDVRPELIHQVSKILFKNESS